MSLLSRLRDAQFSLSDRTYTRWLRRQPGVTLGRVTIEGRPLVDVRAGSTLVVEDGVRLKSRNWGYHLNMYGPVKLMADAPGAVITIGARTRIYGSCIHAFASVTIGPDCLIAANCQIIDANGHELSFPAVEARARTRDQPRPVVVEAAVWLGTGVIVLPGVRIGRGSVVGAGSVVTRDIPPMSLAAGNPARVIRTYRAGDCESHASYTTA
jgi:acetyltransferase-like isoleucine patch superfamily enzyme